MEGRTEIINSALLYMNQDTILDPLGESKNAKLCAQVYDTTLQECLSGHPWSFALIAAELQQLNVKPLDVRFKYAYQMPKNAGRVRAVSFIRSQDEDRQLGFYYPVHELEDRANTNPIPQYIVQGTQLYTNHQHLQITYSRLDVTPNEMTPEFRDYFALAIANKLWTKVTGSRDGQSTLTQMMVMSKSQAQHTDSEQTDTLPQNRPNLFVNARDY